MSAEDSGVKLRVLTHHGSEPPRGLYQISKLLRGLIVL